MLTNFSADDKAQNSSSTTTTSQNYRYNNRRNTKPNSDPKHDKTNTYIDVPDIIKSGKRIRNIIVLN